VSPVKTSFGGFTFFLLWFWAGIEWLRALGLGVGSDLVENPKNKKHMLSFI